MHKDRLIHEGKACKRRLTSLEIAWIEYRKAYDMLPHSWILKPMEVVGVAGNVTSLINRSIKKWNTKLKEGSRSLINVKIR